MESIEAFAQIAGIHAFMNSHWGWPAMESLHFVGLSLLIGSVGLFDLRLLGFARAIPAAALHRLVPWGVLGFFINLVTGMMFFVSDPDQYLYNPAFQLKVLAMLIAGVNMLLFYRLMHRRIQTLPLPAGVPLTARLIALVSLSSWIAVISLGRLITFYRPPEHWCFWCRVEIMPL